CVEGGVVWRFASSPTRSSGGAVQSYCDRGSYAESAAWRTDPASSRSLKPPPFRRWSVHSNPDRLPAKHVGFPFFLPDGLAASVGNLKIVDLSRVKVRFGSV